MCTAIHLECEKNCLDFGAATALACFAVLELDQSRWWARLDYVSRYVFYAQLVSIVWQHCIAYVQRGQAEGCSEGDSGAQCRMRGCSNQQE